MIFKKLEVVKACESGLPLKTVAKQFRVNYTEAQVWLRLYREKGLDGLKSLSRRSWSASEREEIVREHLENKLSLSETCVRYGIQRSTLLHWCKAARERGYEALSMPYSKKRSHGNMGRPRKLTEAEMTELERLRKENQELKTDIALLKKVRALVDERNARLRGIGRKPSKD